MKATRYFKKTEDFRVLFVYPNIQMSALAPQGIGYLSAVLKRAGFATALFDSTFYVNEMASDTNQEKVNLSIVRPFSWTERGIQPKTADMAQDFQKMVDEFQPDLLAVSVVENTWYIAEYLLNSLKEHVPAIVGGVFATYAPEIVLSHPRVDWACRGEGEVALLALCTALCEGRDTMRIPNLSSKRDGTIVTNPVAAGLDMDDLPFPDWSIFEEQSLYRPMQGRVYKTIGVETQRGCPYKCTFCNSPSNNTLYKAEGAGLFYRKKSVKRIAQELDYMVKHVQPEFIYFVVDTFLAMSDRELDEFSEMYQSYRIPFWMNTRAETVNERRAEHLEKMNCLRINIGIEHGNEEYRRKALQRPVTNKTMLDSFGACSGRKFVTVANSIVGLPDETRELAMDTVRFNRQLPKDIEASGAFIFTPYHGTPLREYAIEKGYVERNSICSLTVTKGSILNMPHFPPEEIQGLSRVFSFYVKMPESRWDEIRQAERATSDEESFVKLRDEFNRDFRRSDVGPKDVSAFDLVIDKDKWNDPGSFSDLHG